ncbi:large subunit ribosomal protein L25 [Diaminobutyricimonas aerilata]|uniref:Large ribosomal subunit protein bL25 n=1 Tax=Diaminobutyricimonas aerilata TaxID=1162967 RepID=A0A2M9CHP9_9MICO|nr:50S ribosomal protein L25/general stress protein Ctc [Diaminobutyricimonas aerilata]PJJ71441.1 large subunit ribosomal protein L25 [Diaminobutyricimonas aerilata]
MADNTQLKAELRTQFGKGAARKIRAVNKIPAVIYGHGTEPMHVTLPGHEVALILRKANAVLDLDIEGTSRLALVKDVQKDPVRQIIEHIDLIIVRSGEKVTIDVPVRVEGESAPGTIHMLEVSALTVEAEATHIPESVTIDIEGKGDGTQILASDVTLPAGTILAIDPDTLVLNVTTPSTGAGDDESEGGESAEGSTENAGDSAE